MSTGMMPAYDDRYDQDYLYSLAGHYRAQGMSDDDAVRAAKADIDAQDAHYASLAHDCPREQFLDDPITRASGVGGEMLRLVHCAVCEDRERD